jgi:hypothetical protein
VCWTRVRSVIADRARSRVRREDVGDTSAAEGRGADRLDGQRRVEQPHAGTQDDRMHDKPVLVDQAGRDERPREPRPALRQQVSAGTLLLEPRDGLGQVAGGNCRLGASPRTRVSSRTRSWGSRSSAWRTARRRRARTWPSGLSGMDDPSCSSRFLVLRLQATAETNRLPDQSPDCPCQGPRRAPCPAVREATRPAQPPEAVRRASLSAKTAARASGPRLI